MHAADAPAVRLTPRSPELTFDVLSPIHPRSVALQHCEQEVLWRSNSAAVTSA